ncbi:MAG: flagellar export chaperone FliS [Phycisphaerales bacterium JB050]
MSFDVNNPYFRNQVLTATPEKLRLLLLDGCIRFMEDGREGLLAKDYEKMYNGFSQARDIVMELISGMKPEVDPDLCSKLGALYTFVFKHLTEAGFEKSVAKVDECLKIMRYERDTWGLVCEKVWKEKGESTPVPILGTPAPTPPKATGTYGPASRPTGGGLSFSA